MPVSPVDPGDATIKLQNPSGIKKPEPSEKNKIAAKKVARDFEAMFVGMMIKSMRDSVGKDSLTNGGHGEEVYRSLLDQEYAKAVSENHSLGLAERIEKELLKSLPCKDSGTMDKDRQS